MPHTPPHPSPAAQAAAASTSSRHRWLPHGSEGARYRWGVASRAVAAIGGGYVLAALVTAVLALFMPTSRVEAALTGTLASFAVYTVAVMWVFAARTAWRAWRGLLIPCVLLGLVLLAHFYGGKAA
jgi:hypothetical protein